AHRTGSSTPSPPSTAQSTQRPSSPRRSKPRTRVSSPPDHLRSGRQVSSFSWSASGKLSAFLSRLRAIVRGGVGQESPDRSGTAWQRRVNQCRSRLRMSIFQRIATIFGAKANKALDKAENPNETLDYSYQKQLELLQKVRRGVADVATSRKRLELQMNQLEQQQDKLSGQAQKAMEIGREDLAREALTRKSGLTQQINDLQSQHEGLQGEEQ